jgi:hypothetical protein
VTPNQTPESLPRQLPDGLLLRRAQPADIDALVEFIVRIHDEPALGLSARDLMDGTHPTTSIRDFVVVVDEEAGGKIAAAAGLIAQTWSYAGIPFEVGNPEFVSTDPVYRRRGLMRAVFDGLHTLSRERGDLVQAIQGLRWFYRQFGYEYALLPGARRQLALSDLAAYPSAQPPARIRRAAESDIPFIQPLYRQQCAGHLITNVLSESIRRADIRGYSPGSDLGDRLFTIEDEQGGFAGYFSTWADPWGCLTLKELAFGSPAAGERLLPAVLRFLADQVTVRTDEFDGDEPTAITFELAHDHPALAWVRAHLGLPQPRPDWYMRLPDLPAFIRRIQPVLEQRLAQSTLKGFSGEIKMTFFIGGLRMVFADGVLAEVDDWEAAGENEAFDMLCFPPLVFLKLLFGYRSLDELRYAYPDCWADDRDAELLRILFPSQPSWLRMI